jgi:hypothetical protein
MDLVAAEGRAGSSVFSVVKEEEVLNHGGHGDHGDKKEDVR